jgi:hypothetical protein
MVASLALVKIRSARIGKIPEKKLGGGGSVVYTIEERKGPVQ